jgi:hypothetical protein
MGLVCHDLRKIWRWRRKIITITTMAAASTTTTTTRRHPVETEINR